jgi:hypothetical protein
MSTVKFLPMRPAFSRRPNQFLPSRPSARDVDQVSGGLW